MQINKSHKLLKLKQLVKDFAKDPHQFMFIPDLNQALNHLEKTCTLMMGVRGPPKTPYFNGIYILCIDFTEFRMYGMYNTKIKLPVGSDALHFVKNYTPLALNVSKSGIWSGLLYREKNPLIVTLYDLVDIIFIEVFCKCISCYQEYELGIIWIGTW